MTTTPLLDAALTPEEQVARLNAALRLNKYMGGKVPTVPQAAFMLSPYPETLYGGAAGPGKSTGALMKALMFVDVKGYAALIVRRTFKQLSAPGGLMSKAREWLEPTDAQWNEETKTWTFPSGATLTFGHIEHPGTGPDDLGDETNYQGQEYQCIIPDELTQFPTPWPYLYLMSRLRRLLDSPVPVRMGATSNPGGVGHEWVDAYFGCSNPATRSPDTHFIAALMETNPHLDRESYLRGLGKMDPVTQAQLIHGNWTVRPTGDLFKVDHLRTVPRPAPDTVLGWVRYWDKAGTGTAERGAKHAKYTVGLLMARVPKALYGVEYIVADVVRFQASAGARDARIKAVAASDPPGTVIWIEQEPGSGGKQSAEISVADLAGYVVKLDRPHGTGADKLTRARPVATQIEYYNVGVVDGAPWRGDLEAELRPAPNGLYWDQIDCLSGAFNQLRLLLAAPPAVATQGRTLGAGLRLPIGGGLR